MEVSADAVEKGSCRSVPAGHVLVCVIVSGVCPRRSSSGFEYVTEANPVPVLCNATSDVFRTPLGLGIPLSYFSTLFYFVHLSFLSCFVKLIITYYSKLNAALAAAGTPTERESSVYRN